MQSSTKVTAQTATGASGDPVAVLAFNGDIASTSKDPILAAYHAIAPDLRKVLLDFGGVEYINSSGIAIIIQMLLEASKTGQRTVGIFGLNRHFSKVFTMVGVAKYARIAPDEAAALAEL